MVDKLSFKKKEIIDYLNLCESIEYNFIVIQ